MPTGTPKTCAAGRDLPLAIASALVLFAWIIAGLLWWPPLFVAFWMAALCVGSMEIANALTKLDLQAERIPIMFGIPITVAAAYLFGLGGRVADAQAAALGGLMLTVLVGLLVRIRRGLEGFVLDSAASLFTATYLGVLGLPLILVLSHSDGSLRALLLFVCVPACDTGAYAVGSLLGRHKMAPKISPAKTWEGLTGGLVLAGAAGGVYVRFVLGSPWWVGAIIGVALGLAAALGDLVESMIKRNAGIKDMGSAVPGHGGAMDRLDSLLAAAPVLWLLQYVLL